MATTEKDREWIKAMAKGSKPTVWDGDLITGLNGSPSATLVLSPPCGMATVVVLAHYCVAAEF